MIYKIGIISKRYLIMFGILRWHVQLIIVWSQIVHQVLKYTRLDYLQNWHHLQNGTYLIMFQKNRYLIMFGILRWHVQLIIVWSQIVPGTRDETKQGYLSRPVRDPEQRRAPAARGVRRGMHGMG